MRGAGGDAASRGTLAAIAVSSLFVGYVLPSWFRTVPGAGAYAVAAALLLGLCVALARWGGRWHAGACALGGAAGLALRLLTG